MFISGEFSVGFLYFADWSILVNTQNFMRNKSFHWCDVLKNLSTLETKVPKVHYSNKFTHKETIEPTVFIYFTSFTYFILTNLTFAVL
jgi:uncharacterized Fe-S radical SAM superfamily protein PflX